jgi:phenylacetate-CoA ligase
MSSSTILHAIRVLKRHVFYSNSQNWSKEQIELYQDKKLIQIVKHAATNVPYYRNLFSSIGFDVNKFRGRKDMHKVPLLDKQTLRTHQKEFIADNADRFGINWETTSGSTGTPLNLAIDNSTKAHKLAAVLRSYRWAGYIPWKKTFSIQSYKFADPKAIYKRYPMVNMWRFNSRLLSKDASLEILAMINDLKPEMMIGYPFSIYMLSKFAKDEGIPIHPIRSIVTAGETLSEKRRKLLEEAYHCSVYDFYSHHEDVAIISECQKHSKHLFDDFSYTEIIDAETGEIKTSGTGELVGTGFYNYAMPLIRYRVGDKVVLDGNQEACPCGCKFRTLEEIIGRQNDYIVTPDGRYIGNVLEHAIDKSKGVILSQCVQDSVNHVYLNLIVDNTFSKDSIIDLEKGIRARLGDELLIDYKIVTELEKKPSGKTPFIMSKIGQEFI